MTTDVSPVNSMAGYDPDDAPEQVRTLLYKLTVSAYVENQAAADAIGEDCSRSYKQFFAKANIDDAPCWYLAAEGVDVIRDDGTPFRSSDLIKLTDKRGRPMSKGQAPDILAQQYRSLGVTASYARVGQSDSAVGRIFEGGRHEAQLGGGYKKSFNLWPFEAKPEGFVYDGDVRPIPTKKADSAGAPEAPTSALAGEELNRELQRALVGKTPGQAFDAIMDNPNLKVVSTFEGQPLLEAASDESLTKLLSSAGVLEVGPSGTFIIPV